MPRRFTKEEFKCLTKRDDPSTYTVRPEDYPSVEEPYKYDKTGIFREENLPNFAKFILEDLAISDRDKEYIKNNFLYQFLTDENFKEQYFNKDLCFLFKDMVYIHGMTYIICQEMMVEYFI